MKHKKHGIFTEFGTGIVFKNLVIFLRNGIKNAIYTRGSNFLLCGRNFEPFWPENFVKSWQNFIRALFPSHLRKKCRNNHFGSNNYMKAGEKSIVSFEFEEDGMQTGKKVVFAFSPTDK
jgi:hypothetical protein